MKNIYKIGKELFVTNDEEIKEGDWYLVELFNIDGKSKGLHIEKCTKLDDVWCNNFDIISTRHKNNCKKIILTTDQDLIKDGVQAIDDEFLEWFVKNPSCEEVEVEHIKVDDARPSGYKIAIPKKEQNKNLYSEEQMDNAYDKGFKDAIEKMYSEEDLECAWDSSDQNMRFQFSSSAYKVVTFKQWLDKFKNK